MPSQLPETGGELDTLAQFVAALQKQRDFLASMGFCEHVRRAFFTAHGRLLLLGESVSGEIHDRFVHLVEEGLSVLDEMIDVEIANKTRMQGYRRSVCFRLDCMKILVSQGEQKAFEKLTFGVYIGALKPVGVSVEEKLLRQFAHLQWELEHEQGPFVEASQVFAEITKPYKSLLDQSPSGSNLHASLRAKLVILMTLLTEASAKNKDSASEQTQAKLGLRRAATILHNLVAPEVEADPSRAKRAYEDHMSVLGNTEWLREYQGLFVAIGMESGVRAVRGAGKNPKEAMDDAKQKNPGLKASLLTCVEVPRLVLTRQSV